MPNDPELADDLAIVSRKPTANAKLQIASKDEIRRRGHRSPDVADALALTFAPNFDLLPDRRREHRRRQEAEASRDYGASGADLDWMAS